MKENNITDEAKANKDNYINIRLDPTSNKESGVKYRKVDVFNQYKPIIQRRERETKKIQKMKLMPSEHMK